jgi:hypothetical protein
MSAFVGVKRNVSASDLKRLLDRYATLKSRYFLRWAHRVSGIKRQIPEDFPSPEGQMFDHDRELRWRQQGQQFSVLMLSTQDQEPEFSAIAADWTTKEFNAKVHSRTETRFPRGIQDRDVNIAQRCFINTQTATVHFVALMVKD